MNKILLVLSCLTAIFSGCASAQTYPQKTIKGEDYYVYKVEPGNTLYAISRQFSVGVDALINANPEAKSGLSIGQQILVPIDDVDKKKARNTEVILNGNHLLHVVQKKETLFSISMDYGVDVNKLIELNPKSETDLGTGDTLKIPSALSNFMDDLFLQPAENDSFVVHQVRDGESAYSLAKKYGISVDSLNGSNSNLSKGMKSGQYVIIPVYRPDYLGDRPELRAAPNTPRFAYPEEIKDHYTLGLLLPFELHYNDSLQRSLLEGKDLYVLTEIALEYYRGAMIALDSLKSLGLSADVYVYDVGDNVVDARDVVKKPEFNKMDILFGPMHKSTLGVISEASKKNQTYIVSPNSFANEVFEDNPYLLRAQASRQTIMRYLANYVAIQHQFHNVLMVNSESSADWPYRKLFRRSYNEAVSTFQNTFADSLRSISKGNLRPEEITKWLRKDTLNVLVVPSTELAFVSDFMTKLSRVNSRDYRIQVYGLDNWLRYDNIDAEYKNRFHLRLVAPYYLNYDSKELQTFLQEFRTRYDMEPSQYGYAFMGFDQVLYFGKALVEHGLAFPYELDAQSATGIVANYRYGKSTTGKEMENKAVYILEYDTFKIKSIN